MTPAEADDATLADQWKSREGAPSTEEDARWLLAASAAGLIPRRTMDPQR